MKIVGYDQKFKTGMIVKVKSLDELLENFTLEEGRLTDLGNKRCVNNGWAYTEMAEEMFKYADMEIDVEEDMLRADCGEIYVEGFYWSMAMIDVI